MHSLQNTLSSHLVLPPSRLIQLEMPGDLLDGLLVQVVGVGAPVDVLVRPAQVCKRNIKRNLPHNYFAHQCTVRTQLNVKTRLRELAQAGRGSQDAGSRNLVFTCQLSTVNYRVATLDVTQEMERN